MTLLIDTPRWPWRGRLWAHLISDDSLEELHGAAQALDLRYVSFGCDHYDVPDHRWSSVCEVAELVDSREIVRSLRRSGLRVPGGKPRKSWRQADLPDIEAREVIDAWLAEVHETLVEPAVEVLARPGEWVVIHLLRSGERPDLGGLVGGPAHANTSVRETVADGRYSLELIIEDGRRDR